MEHWSEQKLHGWGRFPVVDTEVARPERRREVERALGDLDGLSALAYGLGRSYGDAALIEGGRTILTQRMDRLISFDPSTGWLRCEAGVSIKTIIDIFAPRGFFPPVVAGTQYVTIAGAIANDIHGKNHHVDGTIADHVRRVELMTASGEIVTCDADTEPALFWATVGGLGLTGIILSAELKLYAIDTPYIDMESIRTESLDEFFAVNAESSDFTHTVTWIDSVASGEQMGRGIFMRGRHAVAGAQPSGGLLSKMVGAVKPLMAAPMDAPNWAMNQLSMKLFNTAYFRKHPRGRRQTVVHYEPFFFPLDAVSNWNRIYGKRGMLQYQLVVPHDPNHAAVKAVLSEISKAGMASFLTVIKEFGSRQHPGLSFPTPGITLALDFPNYGAPLLRMLERLDEIVVAAKGRVYLGKDARLSRESFRQMYPNWEEWKAVRDTWDPEHVFQSNLGRRLGLVGKS